MSDEQVVLWITARVEKINEQWVWTEIIGIFESEELATAACRQPNDMIGPFCLNAAGPIERVPLSGGRYPLIEQANREFLADQANQPGQEE